MRITILILITIFVFSISAVADNAKPRQSGIVCGFANGFGPDSSLINKASIDLNTKLAKDYLAFKQKNGYTSIKPPYMVSGPNITVMDADVHVCVTVTGYPKY